MWKEIVLVTGRLAKKHPDARLGIWTKVRGKGPAHPQCSCSYREIIQYLGRRLSFSSSALEIWRKPWQRVKCFPLTCSECTVLWSLSRSTNGVTVFFWTSGFGCGKPRLQLREEEVELSPVCHHDTHDSRRHYHQSCYYLGSSSWYKWNYLYWS